MPDRPRPITALDHDALAEVLGQWDEPAYRAGQITDWIYVRGATDWAAMTNLPVRLRQRLDETFLFRGTACAETIRSDDGTVKLAIALADGNVIETAGIPQGRRYTACLSTQVGCAQACAFCASGRAGLVRNLDAFEIVEQVLHLSAASRKPTHVVFMGVGEPLENYGAVSEAIDRLCAAWAFGIARRRITVSTVGAPDAIRRLAREHPQVNLAVSLHAAEDALRSRLIPANREWPLKKVLDAVRYHQETTRRQPTFEVVVLAGVNDTASAARALARTLSGMDCTVNLIACHRDGGGCDETSACAFADALGRLGLRVTVRRSRGRDIDAACGQLRISVMRRSTARIGEGE